MSANLEAFVGQILDGRYRLDKLLGAGGMGAVYEARDTESETDVAIKILHPDIGADPSISKRFDREAQSASRLDHPNCVRVSEFGTTAAGIKYLVMELLVGEELGARLGRPWEPDAALEVLEQILAGLAHAHDCGIVHRDLKPENVFMHRDADGHERAKIVDFGIAKLLDADGAVEVLTRAGMVFGTPRYMSPEQAAGGKIDERSDLYAVGVLAHELLSGQPPFDADDLAAILRMQIMAPPPPLPDTVPAPVAAFVESLLEKSRHARPDSAAAALATVIELRAALRERQITADAGGGDQTMAVDMLGATGMHEVHEPGAFDPDAPLPSKPEAMLGHRVGGRFTLEALLGIGGMGAVFRARDARTGSVVAVKLLHAALAGDEELAARFEREAETAGELEHPNIAPVFEHGTTAGIGGPAPYLIMPLLEGVELRALIGAPLEPARAVDLMNQLLAALEHAHACGVVHRDLKPENVFVIRDPAGAELVQLVDFGLAKVAEDGERGGARRALTQFGQVFGTPAYMSPEQCRGEVVDARTDLYAAGIILYELLAGRAPFDGDDPVALLRMQLEAPPPPLPEHVPAPLRAVVDDLLIKDRNHRIPDARTAIDMLSRALVAAPATAPTLAPATATVPSMSAAIVPPPAAPPARLPRRARLPRTWLYVGGAVVALLVIIAAWPSGSSESVDADEDHGEVPDEPPRVARDDRPSFLIPKPAPEVYVEIDRELTAKNAERALELIRTARDQFPGDGGLLWREARALALGGETDRITALHRYAEALAADATLSGTTEFEAELRNLLRDPKLRGPAIDVAVRELGQIGHSFLLATINDETAKLSYVDRHRILDALAGDLELYPRVDLRRQLALDLDQAASAPAPCSAFAAALDEIAESDDPYFLEPLYSRSLAIPSEPGVGEDASACTNLEARREEVKAGLAASHPQQAAKLERSSKKKSKKKGGFRLPF